MDECFINEDEKSDEMDEIVQTIYAENSSLGGVIVTNSDGMNVKS